jgi:hypothetical protein
LRQHRRDNVRLLDQRPFTSARSRAESQARKLNADARLRELELAREEGRITLIDEVAEGAHAAVAAMRSAFDFAVNDSAEQLALRLGVEPRLVRPHLRAMATKALEAFVRAMSDYANAERKP